MNKINAYTEQIQKDLTNIIGEVLHFDLSADEVRQIQDKKGEVLKALFSLKDEITQKTTGRYYAG